MPSRTRVWRRLAGRANLEVFWSGTAQEYFRLYDVSAAAIRAVDPGLRVGGPASAAAGWIGEFLDHVADSGAPVDFLSTHVYGNVPLDLRPVLAGYGRAGTPTWWTEWGPTPTHFHRVGDTIFAAAFLLRGMASAMGRIESLSHWVASDHFEELGTPPELFHGGFGLLSVGNLRKPRYWALDRLTRLGPQRLPVAVDGDGAGGLVEALAARADDGRISILVWNVTLDQRTIGAQPGPAGHGARGRARRGLLHDQALPHRRGPLQHHPGLGGDERRIRLAGRQAVGTAAGGEHAGRAGSSDACGR